MYFKGNNILHTARQIINDDQKWRSILRGLNKEFYHSTVTTDQIEKYISEKAGIDLSSYFDQYLRTPNIPELEIERAGKAIRYRWTNVIDDFAMPLDVSIDKTNLRLMVTSSWQKVKGKDIKVNPNYYIKMKEISSD